jgi:DNA polymerase III alpha subunit (gram-positive type)
VEDAASEPRPERGREGVMKPEIYVSVDIETTGPAPDMYSMISLAAVAYDATGKEIGFFIANLEEAPGAARDDNTMKWWQRFPEAWAAATKNPEPPEKAMKDFALWLDHLPGKLTFVGYPAGFDFTFVYYYLIRFAERSPFSFSSLDMKTLAWVLLGGNYYEAVKKYWPRRWFDPSLKHSHVALEDAREQGASFFKMVAELNVKRTLTGRGIPREFEGRQG